MYVDADFRCWEFVFPRGAEVLNSDGFLHLPKDFVVKLLASDELVADENVVYERAVNWAEQQLE